MPDLPERPSLEHLRKQAKTRKRERAIGVTSAQHELAREYGFGSWPKLIHHVQTSVLEGISVHSCSATHRRCRRFCSPTLRS